MAYPQPKYTVETRDADYLFGTDRPLVPSFIISECHSPVGHSRRALKDSSGYPIQMDPGVKIGDPVTARGTKAKPDGTDFAGIALVQMDTATGRHTNGDFGGTILFRDAAIKSNDPYGYGPYSEELVFVMSRAGIIVVPTGR